MNTLPHLRGKHYHTTGPNGEEKLWVITDVETGRAKDTGRVWIDRIQVQCQKVSEAGFISWTRPRWILYGKHIQQRIAAYERQFETGGAA